ncbi:MAG TPA: prolyl oligopeptidase family serine peptidase, partial [Actinomycetes bacterium]|nr:prolyl oligopeptidase family serine peptidase [Actinomycetes bacterium]
DPYAWLSDRDRPDTAAYLAAERTYYETATEHLRSLRGELFSEMRNRLLSTDESVRWRRGPYVYSTRTVEGADYTQLLRREAGSADESTPKVVLDENDLLRGGSYLATGVVEPSPDGRLLAYSVDHTGDEVFRLHFRDVDRGVDLDEVIPRSYYGAAWSADSSTFFYTVHDEAYRPFQLWRHRIGTPAERDVLVLAEDDEQFELTVENSRSGRYVVIASSSRDTTEVHLVSADEPTSAPVLVEARRKGVEYAVAHAPRPDGDVLLIVTNDGATEFRLVRAPVESPGRDSWEELVGEHPLERLASVDVFSGHVVLTLHTQGRQVLRIVPRDGSETALDVDSGDPAASIALWRNEDPDATEVTVVVESWVSPPVWYAVDLDTGARRELKRLEVPGFDPSRYVSERLDVASADGVRVPVTISRRRDVDLDGTAPCLLYGYGAYESSSWPEWENPVVSLLDRGVVYAVAHVRGGGECGRSWWLHGCLAEKQNTFEDYLAVADRLGDGLVDPDRIVSRGLSAGGLLQGAVFSQRPDRWRAVVAEVPFVDVVTTMLDPSVPLTPGEWDEWGDPRRPADFAVLLAYSPYDNLPAAGGRPDLLVTGAVHDARVMYWEPAKWVAALRASDPEWSPRCLFRIETGVGSHVGPSGRYGHLAYESEVLAWVLDRLGRR